MCCACCRASRPTRVPRTRCRRPPQSLHGGELPSAPGLLKHLLNALLAGDVVIEARLLLLAPLLHLLDRDQAGRLVLLVPVFKSLGGLFLGLIDAEEELGAEGVDRLGFVELIG